MAYTDVGERHPLLDGAMRPNDARDLAAARYVVRRCPDDWDEILNALGIGD